MKLLYSLLAGSILLLPACQTARDTTADAGDIAGHAVAKTGSVIHHGGEKIEEATQ